MIANAAGEYINKAERPRAAATQRDSRNKMASPGVTLSASAAIMNEAMVSRDGIGRPCSELNQRRPRAAKRTR